jgi:hypothetical protein
LSRRQTGALLFFGFTVLGWVVGIFAYGGAIKLGWQPPLDEFPIFTITPLIGLFLGTLAVTVFVALGSGEKN